MDGVTVNFVQNGQQRSAAVVIWRKRDDEDARSQRQRTTEIMRNCCVNEKPSNKCNTVCR